MKSMADRSERSGSYRFVSAFQDACRKLVERQGEVCTLGLSLLTGVDDAPTDVKVYVVPKDGIAHEAIEAALNRVATDEVFIRGVSFRSST